MCCVVVCRVTKQPKQQLYAQKIDMLGTINKLLAMSYSIHYNLQA